MIPREVINCAWQLGGDRALIRGAAKRVPMLSLVECRTKDRKPLPVGEFLGRDWLVLQNLADDSLSGSVHAFHRDLLADGTLDVRHSGLRLLSPAGHKVQARHLRVTRMVENPDDDPRLELMAVGHLGLRSTGVQDDGVDVLRGFVHHARAVRRRRPGTLWAVDGDFNMSLALAAHQLGAPNHGGNGVVGTVYSDGWGGLHVSARPRRGTDHRVTAVG